VREKGREKFKRFADKKKPGLRNPGHEPTPNPIAPSVPDDDDDEATEEELQRARAVRRPTGESSPCQLR
jgi:hypothetical protein